MRSSERTLTPRALSGVSESFKFRSLAVSDAANLYVRFTKTKNGC